MKHLLLYLTICISFIGTPLMAEKILSVVIEDHGSDQKDYLVHQTIFDPQELASKLEDSWATHENPMQVIDKLEIETYTIPADLAKIPKDLIQTRSDGMEQPDWFPSNEPEFQLDEDGLISEIMQHVPNKNEISRIEIRGKQLILDRKKHVPHEYHGIPVKYNYGMLFGPSYATAALLTNPEFFPTSYTVELSSVLHINLSSGRSGIEFVKRGHPSYGLWNENVTVDTNVAQGFWRRTLKKFTSSPKQMSLHEALGWVGYKLKNQQLADNERQAILAVLNNLLSQEVDKLRPHVLILGGPALKWGNIKGSDIHLNSKWNVPVVIMNQAYWDKYPDLKTKLKLTKDASDLLYR